MRNALTLFPQPRHIEQRRGNFQIESGRRLALVGAPAQQLLFSGERLLDVVRESARAEWTLAATASGPPEEIGAVLRVQEGVSSHAQGYELDITPEGIEIAAPSPHGIFNAVATLAQIIAQSGKKLPALHITDHPDFPNRGIMLDISRDKVPTQETLFELIDLLASWKINQLQLYTEHTFTYRNHREVWEHASPLTEHEILELDAFCRARFVELVPNQNSFGHMHRWLKHERYRELAECPDGYDPPKWWGTQPFSLDPTDPRSLELLRELYDELLPNFSSRQFNVGCDETFDLGECRNRADAQAHGVGRLYLDFLKKIYHEVKARGHTMQFWGDIIMNHPELVSELPPDVIAMEWGYEANHPFDRDCEKFARAGIPFYVCPGTSSWNSILGRTDNALANIRSAAENGLKHGAIGLLNTDWGDNGHLQYLPVSYLGFAYGAGVSWCLKSNRDADLPRVLDQFVFHDDAKVMGRVALDLGNVYQSLGREYHNSSGVALALRKSLEEIRATENQDRAGFLRARQAIDRAVRPLARAKMKRVDARLIKQEFENAAKLARHGARRGELAFETNPKRAAKLKGELDRELRVILRAHKKLWHARNRPGGYRDSVARVERARRAYEDE